jgi:hypothetical protein
MALLGLHEMGADQRATDTPAVLWPRSTPGVLLGFELLCAWCCRLRLPTMLRLSRWSR